MAILIDCFNKPIQTYIHFKGFIYDSGERSELFKGSVLKILVVDDSIASGKLWRKVKQFYLNR